MPRTLQTDPLVRRRSRPLLRAATLLSVGLVAVLGGSAFVAAAAGAPRNKPVGQPPAGSALVEVRFQSDDGARLAGWRSTDGTGIESAPEFVVVLAHPIGGSRRAMLGRAEWFRQRGAATLLFDFRGHGTSDATRLTFGERESRDLIAAVERARAFWPQTPIVVDGWSLGAAAALMAGPELEVDGLILESPFTDLRSTVRARGAKVLPLLGPLAADLLLAHSDWILGCDAAEVSPLAHANQVSAPTLFLTGGDDRRAPAEGVRRIAERVADSRGVVVFDGVPHVDLHARATDDFEHAVGSFLDSLRSEWRDEIVATRVQ